MTFKIIRVFVVYNSCLLMNHLMIIPEIEQKIGPHIVWGALHAFLANFQVNVFVLYSKFFCHFVMFIHSFELKFA